MFDPTVGRWFEEDPEGLDAGPNLYEYVGNGPTSGTDPSGLWLYARPQCADNPSAKMDVYNPIIFKRKEKEEPSLTITATIEGKKLTISIQQRKGFTTTAPGYSLYQTMVGLPNDLDSAQVVVNWSGADGKSVGRATNANADIPKNKLIRGYGANWEIKGDVARDKAQELYWSPKEDIPDKATRAEVLVLYTDTLYDNPLFANVAGGGDLPVVMASFSATKKDGSWTIVANQNEQFERITGRYDPKSFEERINKVKTLVTSKTGYTLEERPLALGKVPRFPSEKGDRKAIDDAITKAGLADENYGDSDTGFDINPSKWVDPSTLKK